MTKQNFEILQKAIKLYGKDAQIDIAIEEMAELTKELCKNKRGRNNKANIVEEIADVHIMLEQLLIMFGIELREIQEVEEIKCERLAERMKEDLLSKQLHF